MNSEAISDKFNVTDSVLNYELHHKSAISLMVCDFSSNSFFIVLPLNTLRYSRLFASASSD